MKFVLNTPPSPILTITFLLQLSIYPSAPQRSHIILTLNSFFPESFIFFFLPATIKTNSVAQHFVHHGFNSSNLLRSLHGLFFFFPLKYLQQSITHSEF